MADIGCRHSGGALLRVSAIISLSGSFSSDRTSYQTSFTTRRSTTPCSKASTRCPCPITIWTRSNDSHNRREDDITLDRSVASSTASMMPHKRVEVLQRVNDDSHASSAHVPAQTRGAGGRVRGPACQARGDVQQAQHEGKKLCIKERQNSAQIGLPEAEAVKVSRQLEQSKGSDASFQRQYVDQCALAEESDDLWECEEMKH
ncbi:hypothetical protein C8J57DRAFT_1660402 [Mycena rebaudengoi]|nr:hypothetical protein C8J57DRAFT_1660402 [Mycena rebaudengoi]